MPKVRAGSFVRRAYGDDPMTIGLLKSHEYFLMPHYRRAAMDDVKIPAQFWQEIGVDEFMHIARRGLTEKQCARIWKLLGRTDEPPKSMEAVISRVDIEQLARKRWQPLGNSE